MQQYSEVVVDRAGNVQSGVSIRVNDVNGSLATIYSDDDSTPASNPITTASNGRFSFYAADGEYQINVNGALWQTIRLNDLGASSGSAGIGFIQSGTGAVARTAQDKMRETVSVEDFGISPSRTSLFNRTTLQQLLDDMYERDGGVVRLNKLINIDTSIVVPQRVWLEAEWSGWVNQFVSGEMEPLGGWLVLDAGANVDALVFRNRLYNDGGILRELTHGRRNSEARHHGGARRLGVWGTRSLNQLPTAVDLNNTGNAFSIQGSRYVVLEDCIGMMAAEDAFDIDSYDYGTGAISSNNTKLVRPNALSCAGYGLDIAGGDGFVEKPNCGYNALSGIQITGSADLTGGSCWNNLQRGYVSWVGSATAVSRINGLVCYDNNWNGFYLGGTAYGYNLEGCIARGNGRDTGAADNERANFQIGASVQSWSLEGCYSQATDQDGNLTARYDFYINNTTHAGSIEGIAWDTTAPAPLGNYFASDDNLILHGRNQGASHPGVKFTGTVDVNAQVLNNISQERGYQWVGATITAGAISPGNNGLVSLSEAAPVDLTDINYAGTGLPEVTIRNTTANAVTFKHNTSKLRLNSGADIVLNQYQSITLRWVSGSVWQHTGGKQA